MTGSLAAALEQEHRTVDARIAEYLGKGAVESLTQAMRALRRHIYLEEEFLFPALRAADPALMAPIFVMLREHGQLWGVLDALNLELATHAAEPAIRDLCRELVVLEQHHNPKEERILYPLADHVLTPAATAALRAFLHSGRLPDGWVCERARVPAR